MRLSETVDDEGTTLRDYLEHRARKDPEKRKELAGPPCPAEVRYLVDWAFELFGRSGAGMAGPNPLSHAEIEAWARLNDHRLEPYEVTALIRLDAAMRHAHPSAHPNAKPTEVPKPQPAWPTKE